MTEHTKVKVSSIIGTDILVVSAWVEGARAAALLRKLADIIKNFDNAEPCPTCGGEGNCPDCDN